MKLKKIGVVGAGVMGTGLGENLAQTGHQVVIVDINEEILQACEANIRKNLRFQGFFNRAAKVAEPDEVINRITFTTDYEKLNESEFLVENVTENWEIKHEVYKKIDAICPPECVFAVNTSCVSITKVGSVTSRRDKVVGIHFMNPVPKKPTVEVIKGYYTSDETLDTVTTFLAQFGKSGVVVNDSPGFVSNRVLMLTINEACFCLHEGVSTEADIDRIFVECFGHTMGPLATADLIGVDTILYSLEVLYESMNDPKFRPCPLMRKMVDAGLHGRKSGAGFFNYE